MKRGLFNKSSLREISGRGKRWSDCISEPGEGKAESRTLSGNHVELVPEVIRLMREAGISDIPVLLGGTVPPDDVPKLKEIGVDGIFGPGTALKDIVSHVSKGA